jgi:hypothetical protein
MSRIVIVVSMIVFGLLAVGCADRPSAADLTDSIVKAAEANEAITITGDEARCIADQLLSTDLSDTTLSGLVEDFNEPQVLEAELERVNPAISDAALACIGTS